MQVIDYELCKGTFKIQYLSDNTIYDGTINIDDASLPSSDLAKKIIDSEVGATFYYKIVFQGQECGETIKLIEKNIEKKYKKSDEILYNKQYEKKQEELYFKNIDDASEIHENCIYFKFNYIPVSDSSNDQMSREILYGLKNFTDYRFSEIKSWNQKYYEFFKNMFINCFLKRYNLYGRTICCVPSSGASSINNNSQALMIRDICAHNKFFDGSQTLIRYISIEPQHLCEGKRSEEVHFKSVKVNEDVVGQDIILIDDITTSGCSLKACRKLLLNAGAKSVICFAISKTREKKYE